MEKQTAVEWYTEMDAKITRNFLRGELNQTMYAVEKAIMSQQAKQMEKEQSREALHAAFKAGWMKANATNYNESYFNHYYDNL